MKTPLTEEQKEFYMLGYINALLDDLARDLKVTKDEAITMLIRYIEENPRSQRRDCHE